MTLEAPPIRVKAMLIALNDERTAHAVSVNPATAENPAGFHRLIGGSVEFGETHREAIVREVSEELGATIEGLRYLDVVENIFQYQGEQGHEIVLLYTGRLDPPPAAEGAVLVEDDGAVVPVIWRSAGGSQEALPLYPDGVEACIARLLHS